VTQVVTINGAPSTLVQVITTTYSGMSVTASGNSTATATGGPGTAKPTNIGAIVGGTLGAFLGIIALIVGLVWCAFDFRSPSLYSHLPSYKRSRRWDDIFEHDIPQTIADEESTTQPSPYPYGLVGHVTPSTHTGSPPQSPRLSGVPQMYQQQPLILPAHPAHQRMNSIGTIGTLGSTVSAYSRDSAAPLMGGMIVDPNGGFNPYAGITYGAAGYTAVANPQGVINPMSPITPTSPHSANLPPGAAFVPYPAGHNSPPQPIRRPSADGSAGRISSLDDTSNSSADPSSIPGVPTRRRTFYIANAGTSQSQDINGSTVANAFEMGTQASSSAMGRNEKHVYRDSDVPAIATQSVTSTSTVVPTSPTTATPTSTQPSEPIPATLAPPRPRGRSNSQETDAPPPAYSQ
jgi:hypothetical protein